MTDLGVHSHLPWLASLAAQTKGTFLELGTGDYSTPFLNAAVANRGRLLISYETEKWWAEKIAHFESPDHRIVMVDKWDDVEFPEADVAFVDFHPGDERVKVIRRLQGKIKFIIAHDTEADIPPAAGAYGWASLDGVFKYQTILKTFRPWSTVYSDVEEFKP